MWKTTQTPDGTRACFLPYTVEIMGIIQNLCEKYRCPQKTHMETCGNVEKINDYCLALMLAVISRMVSAKSGVRLTRSSIFRMELKTEE